LVGHRLGGAVELIYAIRHGDDLAGLAVSDPAVATEAVPAALKAVTSVLSAVGPRLSVFKIEDDAISRDPEVVRAYQQDPLNYYGRLPARTLAEIRRSNGRDAASGPRPVRRYCSYTDRRTGCAGPREVGWSMPLPGAMTRR
jgi:alpha-beta hydrolase superfamily lysophospholipase